MENKLTVFCAVWHKDKNREALLRGHMKTLDQLQSQVDRIYVFDGNDSPPKWLKGEIIKVKSELTIYEAWNVALSRVMTPYVMNLNLDDRLHYKATSLMIDALENGADLVGGEWEICFNQNETDSKIYTDNLEFLPSWPPEHEKKTMLGSGNGQRGTYGPACAWKMNLHIDFPRFPYSFSDGKKIKVIGDMLWWMVLKSKNKALYRIPAVIGKYHSHPNDQAEFRSDSNEFDTFKNFGIKIV